MMVKDHIGSSLVALYLFLMKDWPLADYDCFQ